MIWIIILTVVIVLIARRTSKHSSEDVICEEARRIRQSEAVAALARCQMQIEKKMRVEQRKKLKKELAKYRAPVIRTKELEHITSVIPIPVHCETKTTEPIAIGGAAGDDYVPMPPEIGIDSFDTFSPLEWWDEHFDDFTQVDENTLEVPASCLPDRSKWGEIGAYLVSTGEFSDFQICDDKIKFTV